MHTTKTNKLSVASTVFLVIACLSGQAMSQGFSGSFAPSNWGIGSNPPYGNLVDTSGAPVSITIRNYPNWAVSGAGISYTTGLLQTGKVYFSYTTSGTTDACPAAYVVDSQVTLLPSGSARDSFTVSPNQTFSFTLNGRNIPENFGCSSKNYSNISFTISDFAFITGGGGAPSTSDTTTINAAGAGSNGCKALGGILNQNNCSLEKSLNVLAGKTVIVATGVTLALSSTSGKLFTNSGTFVNNGVVSAHRPISNSGTFINKGKIVTDSGFTNSGNMTLQAGSTLIDTMWWSGGITNQASGTILIANAGTSSCPTCRAIQSDNGVYNIGTINIQDSGFGIGIHLNNFGVLNNNAGGTVNISNSGDTGIFISGNPTKPSPSKYATNSGGKIMNAAGTINVANTGGFGIYNAVGTGRGIIENQRATRDVQGRIYNTQDTTGIYNLGYILNCGIYSGLRPLVPNDMNSNPKSCPPDRE